MAVTAVALGNVANQATGPLTCRSKWRFTDDTGSGGTATVANGALVAAFTPPPGSGLIAPAELLAALNATYLSQAAARDALMNTGAFSIYATNRGANFNAFAVDVSIDGGGKAQLVGTFFTPIAPVGGTDVIVEVEFHHSETR